MPLYMPVPLLLATSMHAAAGLVINALTLTNTQREILKDDKVKLIFQNYLSNLPVSLKEKLLYYILDLDELEASVRYRALLLILCPQMKSLCPGIFPQTYFTRVAHVICCQGTTLESLDLRGVWLKGNLLGELQNILQSLKNLRDLHIPHMATDAILNTIGQYNTSLQILDIMGECNVTEAGIESLCNSGNSVITHNLQFVLLGNPGGDEVSPSTVSLLIKYLPKLQSLGSYPKVGEAIEYLIQENSDITTNLIHLHDSYTDLNRICILIKTTPMLDSIFIDHPSDGVISHLCEFSHLTKVKFQRFQLNEFFRFINKVGRKLLTMELMFGSGILDFASLSKQCPNLVKFTCYKMDCIRHFDKVEFPYLKNFGVYYSDISPSCVKSVMLASPNMEKLSLGDFLEITDDDIIEIFTTKEFTKLKHIWFANAVYLTSVSVQILIECCPNLVSLGELSGWNMTQTETIIFKEAIETENLALKIIDYFND
ncbi:hypothetical protein R5R35_004893 [Gryllus longicercus]|uniref:Uncharacterized protein n=1 Tax=Gryllus longicercus TaxID=2509291 RepID=A0AAN9Z4Q7_9ORTH